jgi:hypothetical protein
MVVIIAPVLVYAMMFALLWFQRSSKKNTSAIQAKKAVGVFIREFRESDHTYSELSRLVRDYLNSRFMVNIGTLTPKEAVEILKKKGFGKDICDKLDNVIRVLENAVYTGKGDERASIGEDLADVIKSIDKGVR